jgi:hypothetical protein
MDQLLAKLRAAMDPQSPGTTTAAKAPATSAAGALAGGKGAGSANVDHLSKQCPNFAFLENFLQGHQPATGKGATIPSLAKDSCYEAAETLKRGTRSEPYGPVTAKGDGDDPYCVQRGGCFTAAEGSDRLLHSLEDKVVLWNI